MKDLVVLVADKDMEYALRGLFARPEALGIRPIETRILVHPQHDPACARRGVQFLSHFNRSRHYRHGMLVFDYEGSGRENEEAAVLQRSLDNEFSRSAWGHRAKAIVVSPELEAWVWSHSPNLDDVAGWQGRQPSLREWLVSEGLLKRDEDKPSHPKKAFQEALRNARIPRSASLYRQIAERVSLQRCTDRSFLAFRNLLQAWFPPS